MQGARIRSRRSSLTALLVMGAVIGCAGVACKREAVSEALRPAPVVGVKSVVAAKAKEPVSLGLRQLLVSRRFAEATRAIEILPAAERALPEVQLAAAFAALKTGAGEPALAVLDGLEGRLALLTPDIRELRARAQLLTREAMQGAEYLSQQGELGVWVVAGEALERLGQGALALEASSRGLAREATRKNAGADGRRLRLHALRARVHAKEASRSAEVEELNWLAAVTSSSPEVERLLEAAMAEGKLTLTATARKKRLLRLAEQGQVDALDRELSATAAKGLVRIGVAESLYLRGRARMLARRDQREGAKYFGQAAGLGYGDGTQLRFDAARMLVREGDAQGASRLYEQIERSDRKRAEEAQYYSARAQSILGDPKDADRLYTRQLARYPKGRFAADALHERTLNLLVMGKPREAKAGLRRLLEDSRFRDKRAMLLHLSAVAGEGIDDRDETMARYREVTTLYPLHAAGLFARTRLAAAGGDLPTRAAPPRKEQPTLDAMATPRATLLLTIGLDELAARALREEERALNYSARQSRRAQCAAWSAVGYSARGFAISHDLREEVQGAAVATLSNRWAFDCRFPTPYGALVQEAEQKAGLPSALVFAVMRQESGFDPEIVSPANARGLLQLLPETAERVQRELVHAQGAAISPGLDLTEPRVNLELGSAYLTKLLGLFDGNLVLAVASYNAGPRAVAMWATKANGMPIELFAARIPYTETRGYVERVLANLAMYRYLAEGDQGLPLVSLQLKEKLELSEDLY